MIENGVDAHVRVLFVNNGANGAQVPTFHHGQRWRRRYNGSLNQKGGLLKKEEKQYQLVSTVRAVHHSSTTGS